MVGGCKDGFKPPNQDFVDLLKVNKIEGCIHGHIPFCGTVPLIFKTPSKTGIIEIACDTSNGNRPKIRKDAEGNEFEVNLDNVPLAIVYPDSAGITSVNLDGTFSKKNTLGLNNTGTELIFQNMISNFKFTSTDFPFHNENTIQYPEGIFSFAGQYNPAKFDLTILEKAGGKKTRNKKNNRKTKKNRKTKRKNNNKGKSKRSM